MFILPQLIVFDLAGTTVKDNNDVHHMLQSALESYHVSVTTTDANAVMGIPKPLAIGKLLTQYCHPEITPGLIADIHDLFVKKMRDFYQNHPSVSEGEGVSETFQRLKREKIKIAVDTGFDRSITTSLLDRMGWTKRNLIDASVTSDEVENGRPHPDLIFKAMELTGIKDVTRVAKIGDTASDMKEGKSAGCGWVIGITSGAFTQDELEKENPTHLIRTIPEIISVFDLK